MSNRTEYYQDQVIFEDVVDQNIDFQELSIDDLKMKFHKILNDGIHGICFSMYEKGQKPGDVIPRKQIERRMKILSPHVKWVRSFSCTEGNELVPIVAKENGLQTLVGAWLGSDLEKNENEINSLFDLMDKGVVDIAAVGNEVMYRGDLSEEQLIDYIQRVKAKATEMNIPVGYVDAYYEFSLRPNITAVCDVILTNCYPFWEGTPIQYAVPHMQQMFQHAKDAGNGKPVIITETGWPNKGEPLKSSQPSEENSLIYFISTQMWSKTSSIPVFYFASFDEDWKVGAEGDVGAYWGLWDIDEKRKYQ